MTDHERAVMQQALEALECVDLQSLVPDYGSGHYSVARLDGPQVKSAITALRTALAQQTEPVAMYETDVQLVGELPEFHLLYVQNSQGTRFAVDQDTELQTELLPGVTYRAQVNAEGYALKISRLHDITDSNKDN